MKRYLQILFNRQLVGKWAKTNMVRYAFAAMVAVTMGMGSVAEANHVYADGSMVDSVVEKSGVTMVTGADVLKTGSYGFDRTDDESSGTYFIERNGQWTEINSSNIADNAFVAKQYKGIWYYDYAEGAEGDKIQETGKKVDFTNVYNIDGVYYAFKTGDGSLYKGSVLQQDAANSKVLKSTSIPGGIISAWYEETNDKGGEPAELTVGEVNRIIGALTTNDINLAKADIKEIIAADGEANVKKTYQLKRNDGSFVEVVGADAITDYDTTYTISAPETTTEYNVTKNTYTLTGNDGSTYEFVDTDSTFKAGANINIAADGTISAIDTTYTAGDYIEITSGNVINATYKAGDNIEILQDGTINATVTTYKAGDNINISSDGTITGTDTNTTYTMSDPVPSTVKNTTKNTYTITGSDGSTMILVDTDTTYKKGTNINIADDGTISATDTTYTEGTNIEIKNNIISSTLTEGANITIGEDGTISATDTTYTEGDNITIEDGKITGVDTTYVMSQAGNGVALKTTGGVAAGNVNFIAGDYVKLTPTADGIKWDVDIAAIEEDLGNDTNTKYTMAVSGGSEGSNAATIDLTPNDTSDASHVSIAGDDNIKVAVSGSTINLTLNPEITVDSVTTEEINLGGTTIKENEIKMGNTEITNEKITVDGGTTIEKESITTETVNTKKIILGTTEITEQKYKELVEESQAHTTVIAGKNIEVSEGTDPTTGGKQYTISMKDEITVTTVNAEEVNTDKVQLGTTTIEENKIKMGDTEITNESIETNTVETKNVVLGDKVTLNEKYVTELDDRVTKNTNDIKDVNTRIDEGEPIWSKDTITTVDSAGLIEVTDAGEHYTDEQGKEVYTSHKYTISLTKETFESVDSNTLYSIETNGKPDEKGTTTYTLMSYEGTIDGESGDPVATFTDTNTTNKDLSLTLNGTELTTTVTDSNDGSKSHTVDLKDLKTEQGNRNEEHIQNIYDEIQEISEQNNANYNKLDNRVKKVAAGAAALAALHPLDFDPDDKLTFSAGYGNYRGQNSTAIGAFYRPDEKTMFSAGTTITDHDGMTNAGVAFSVKRVNNVTNSKTAMAREILDLREQVNDLKNLVMNLANKNMDVEMFPDVPENHWAYDYVEGLQKAGIIEGYPDGLFRGGQSCTRYEFAALLFRALKAGQVVPEALLQEFKPELGRFRVDRVKGADNDMNKIERVRVNTGKAYQGRDVYGSKMPSAPAK